MREMLGAFTKPLTSHRADQGVCYLAAGVGLLLAVVTIGYPMAKVFLWLAVCNWVNGAFPPRMMARALLLEEKN